MQNNGDEGDVDEQQRLRFARELQKLRNNEKKTFDFYDAQFGGRTVLEPLRRWSGLHASEVVDALMVNTSIVTLGISLHICMIPAIHLFFDFIQSTPRLEKLIVTYQPESVVGGKVIQDRYEAQMGQIFRVVLQNPSIKELSTCGTFGNIPEAIYDLFANTTTLKVFSCTNAPITKELAFAVAGGLARNTSLREVVLSVTEGPIDIALAGIGFSSTIQSLYACNHDEQRKEFYLAISKVLHLAPSLKTLELGYDNIEGNGGVWIDQIFWDLRQPVSVGLQNLVLRGVTLGEAMVNLSDIASVENANHTLKVLDLSYTTFTNRRSVRVLWNLVGLEKLIVCHPVFIEVLDDNGVEEDPDCWAELMRRNKNISEVEVVLHDDSIWDASVMGIVNGACGHESLETLRIEGHGEENSVVESAGDQLCQLLQGNKTLKTLTLESINVTLEGAALLTEGLFQNKTLQSLGFRWCTIQHLSLTTILQWLLVNQTLKTFDLTSSRIEGGDAHTTCHLLSRVFRQNTSLAHIYLPAMNVNLEDMNLIVGGLMENKILELISFGFSIDPDALNCLERALLVPPDSPSKLSISSIGLPLFPDTRSIYSFLLNLPLMAGIKEVDTWAILGEEANNLLLHAVKEKKTLLSFTEHHDLVHLDFVSSRVKKEIDFYLKLNRFGRQILDFTNVHSSLWPIVLGRMSSDPKDVDALFFFLREYFSNYRGGGNQQPSSPHRPARQQQQRPMEQSPRPCKCARLEE